MSAPAAAAQPLEKKPRATPDERLLKKDRTIARLRQRIRWQNQRLRSEGVIPITNDVERLKARVNRLLMVVVHQRRQLAGDADADDLADELLHSLERDTELYRRRWQRVLAAYLALREVRELPDDFAVQLRKLSRRCGRPKTLTIAALIDAEKRLLPKDLQVLT